MTRRDIRSKRKIELAQPPVATPDGIVELSWQAEGRGGCDDSCEVIWVTGRLAPDFSDADLMLRGLDCGSWELQENAYSQE